MPTQAEYRNTAEEHLKGAVLCHEAGAYLTAHYLCGHSVECILRAYGAPEDRSHDLRVELGNSTYERIVPEGRQAEMTELFQDLLARWNSRDRFADGPALVRELNRRGVTLNVKGDKLKENSARMLDSAQIVVGLGVERWR